VLAEARKTSAMTHFALPGFDLAVFVSATLDEDLGVGLPGGGRDVTSESVIDADARFSGVMDSRDAITVAGLPIAAAFFRKLDPAMEIEILVEEGAQVQAGANLMRLTGSARAMLTAERSALNTVQHLSGIATMTRQYVDAMAGNATLLDTRKTIPGLRHLEKYATRMGGAQNHRMGLWDAAMIKDNHVLVAGGVGPAVARAKAAGVTQVICEVDNLDQIEPALAAGADHLLLDNMGPDTLREAVALVARRVPTEASGGVNLQTIGTISGTGVTYVSVGRLTQSAPAADIGLDFTPL
jgi:nicotinate-nucleotide pyrophosphorylase (carboxylating)